MCLICASCTLQSEKSIMDAAESLLNEQPDSAYSLLNSIEETSLPVGSKLQARYALLYTQAQYKSYHDPDTDSLISIATDYYEEHGNEEDKFYAYLYQGLLRYNLKQYERSAESLMRSLANSISIEDCYAKGQLFGNLSLINLTYHCSDAQQYAWKSYIEFQRGDLEEYAANALILVASCHLQFQAYDSCRITLDQAIQEAKRLSSDFVYQEAVSIKAQYALCVDSLPLAEELFLWLSASQDYDLTTRDLAGLATTYARKGEKTKALNYLSAVRKNCYDLNDSILFFCNSYWVNTYIGNSKLASSLQDTILHLEERRLSDGLRHTSIAAQKEYSEMKYNVSEFKNQRKTIVIVVAIILLFALGVQLITLYRKRQIEIKLLQQTIQKMQLEKEQHSTEYENGLRSLLCDDFVITLRDIPNRKRGLSPSELAQLSALFCKQLPHFESALRELTKLSETEWHICMLLKLDFTPGDISFLLNRTPGAISSARIRMYERVFREKGHTNDWDNFIRGL